MSIVVTGMGIATPLANSPEALQEKLSNREIGYKTLKGARWSDLEKFRTTTGGTIVGENLLAIQSEFQGGNEIDRCDLFSAFAAKKALEDSNLLNSHRGLKIGVVCGTNFGNAEAFKNLLLSDEESQDFLKYFQKYQLSSLTENICSRFDINGPHTTISLSCASGLSSLALAKRWLESFELDAVVAVSVDEMNMYIFSGLHSLRAMSSKNILRPWDKNRKGTIFSEGSGAVVLMTHEKAIELGITPHAEILSMYQNNDGFHLSAPDVTGRGISNLISETIRLGGISPDEIDFINLHGTGTIYNDKIETLAIETVFGSRASEIPVTSNKGSLGHLMGGAGMVEAISTILSIKSGVIPPTANLEQKDPELNLNIVSTTPLKHNIKYAISNSFGFGGANSCALLKSISMD